VIIEEIDKDVFKFDCNMKENFSPIYVPMSDLDGENEMTAWVPAHCHHGRRVGRIGFSTTHKATCLVKSISRPNRNVLAISFQILKLDFSAQVLI
jgi:hypothetical protein